VIKKIINNKKYQLSLDILEGNELDALQIASHQFSTSRYFSDGETQ
jgi:hypothetical protein